jgi:hypothetical protein
MDPLNKAKVIHRRTSYPQTERIIDRREICPQSRASYPQEQARLSTINSFSPEKDCWSRISYQQVGSMEESYPQDTVLTKLSTGRG